MFRIIPKDKKYDKLKLTWEKWGRTWYLACSKYPEIMGAKSPFDIVEGKENWLVVLDKYDNDINPSTRWVENQNSKKIRETMSLISDNAKKYIEEYYKKYGEY